MNKDSADLKSSDLKTAEIRRFLNEKWESESLFPDEFPGKIVYPSTYTLEMHQAYQEMITESGESDTDGRPILVMAGDGSPWYFTLRNVKAAIKFAESIDITDARGARKKKINLDKPGELPIEVAAWLGLSMSEYLNKHTKFPGLPSRNLEIPKQ